MTPDEEIRRANEARQLLDSEIWRLARAHVESQLGGLRQKVPISASDMHTRLILMEQLWGSLLGFFEQAALTGKFAELKIQEEEKRRVSLTERIAMFGRLGRGSI